VGLGLHVAREIVRLHGGSLTVDERAGSGATFLLVLPKVAA
jgi:signal transduction histidine kinase